MTTNASKYGLRAAAAERRTRHAQRTPLPPRPGTIEDAKEAIEMGMKFQVTSKSPGTGRGPIPVQRPVPEEETAPAPKKVKKGKDKKGKPQKGTFEAPSSNGEATGAEVGASIHHPKALAFCVDAAGAGWTTEIRTTGKATSVSLVIAHRGDERIEIEWENGAQITAPTYWRPDGTTGKLRNASAARKQMAEAAPTDEQLAVRRQRAQRVIGVKAERVRRPMKLDLLAATEDEVIEHLKGRKICWLNSISGQEESAHVGGKTRLREDSSGQSITFITSTGFRTVRLSSITEVR